MKTAYRKGSATSEASAKRLDESGAADSQANYILGFLEQARANGATVDELTIAMQGDAFPMIHNGTVAGRVVHLEHLFKVKKSDQTRKTSSGRMAVVYVSHDGTPYEIQKTKRELIADALETGANFLNGLVKSKTIQGSTWEKRAPEVEEILREALKEVK